MATAPCLLLAIMVVNGGKNTWVSHQPVVKLGGTEMVEQEKERQDAWRSAALPPGVSPGAGSVGDQPP